MTQAVEKYLSSAEKHPFFLVVGEDYYVKAVNLMSELGFTFVKTSDFCLCEDKPPDIDSLFGSIKNVCPSKGNRKVVLGLGEYLALMGGTDIKRSIFQLRDLKTESGKVVILLRFLADTIRDLNRGDPRFDKGRFYIAGDKWNDISITAIAPRMTVAGLKGLKGLLKSLEDGLSGDFLVTSELNFDDTYFNIKYLEDAYEAIKFFVKDFELPRSCGNDTQWNELLGELALCGDSFKELIERKGFGITLETDFYSRISGNDYKNWFYFITLKIRAKALVNNYLRFVLDKTHHFGQLKTNVLNTIMDILHTDKRFSVFYEERKSLIEKFPEADIANFVVNNRLNFDKSIYYLTDVSRTEREEVVAWISGNGVIPDLTSIYPHLNSYMRKYVFNCGDLSATLTDYFYIYKLLKVLNKIEPSFLEMVEKLAQSRDYNRLPTRNEILDKIDKDGAYLYWLDSLGVEYLSFIVELASGRGLSVSVHIARSNLPTITSMNRDFYDDWEDGKKEKNGALDDIKHKEEGGYNFENNAFPIHLAKELDVIFTVIDIASTKLALRQYKRFVIASDHGASRLAVIRKQEETYHTDNKGEHSGRCCESFDHCDIPYAAKENGYLILADYGRFKGGRAANVEVHGGASFEEVIVPIIELTLKDGNVIVKLVKEVVTVDFRTGAKITLFFNAVLKNVSLVYGSKRYYGTPIDDNHVEVVVPDIRKAGEYPADVYSKDDLIGKVTIKAQGKIGRIDNDFDDLF